MSWFMALSLRALLDLEVILKEVSLLCGAMLDGDAVENPVEAKILLWCRTIILRAGIGGKKTGAWL